MKRRKPKPVVLEPAAWSFLRLGREMGSSDVPAAELVRDAILSAEVSREVDRLVDEVERGFYDRVDEDMRRGIAFSRRCMACGAVCAVFGVKHADDCDLDRSLTAEQRYDLRNPGKKKQQFRIMAIKSRWALMHDRCVTCWRRPRDGVRQRCVECSERINTRSAELYALRKQADGVESARAA